MALNIVHFNAAITRANKSKVATCRHAASRRHGIALFAARNIQDCRVHALVSNSPRVSIPITSMRREYIVPVARAKSAKGHRRRWRQF